MSTLNKLLDTARETCSLPSDNALGRALGVSGAAVNLWRHGGQIRPKHLTALIAMAEADPGMAVQVMAEQAETPTDADVWGAVASRLMPIMSTVRRAYTVALGRLTAPH